MLSDFTTIRLKIRLNYMAARDVPNNGRNLFLWLTTHLISRVLAASPNLSSLLSITSLQSQRLYGVSWLNVSIEEFIHTVEDYMVWYREKRIKISLGGLSPLEYRQKLGLSA